MTDLHSDCLSSHYFDPESIVLPHLLFPQIPLTASSAISSLFSIYVLSW